VRSYPTAEGGACARGGTVLAPYLVKIIAVLIF
jgi:hypothetical protein